MTATSRTHRIGAFVARIEYPMDGLALIGLATCAYRDGSILMGAICVLFLAGLLLKQAYPRPPDNDDMVMWGVYHERWRFMDAAFRDRHDAEQWVIEHSVGKLGQFGVYPRYGTRPVTVVENGRVIKETPGTSLGD